MVKYGLTQQDMQEYRSAFKTACECTAGIPEAKADWFGYYMAQMAQTYHTRKVMHNGTRSNNAPGIFAHPYGVRKRLSQGSQGTQSIIQLHEVGRVASLYCTAT
uniref:Uncharacterized protein n=2 Tax=unclassified bacterial viruses TaxID=12333 RepID=A0AAU8ECA4_9VIRU